MKQMKIPSEIQLTVNYENMSMPIKELRPVVFNDGNVYCCLLGPDRQTGVFGCGETLPMALLDWECDLKKRIEENNAEDEVTQFVLDKLAASKITVW